MLKYLTLSTCDKKDVDNESGSGGVFKGALLRVIQGLMMPRKGPPSQYLPAFAPRYSPAVDDQDVELLQVRRQSQGRVPEPMVHQLWPRHYGMYELLCILIPFPTLAGKYRYKVCFAFDQLCLLPD